MLAYNEFLVLQGLAKSHLSTPEDIASDASVDVASIKSAWETAVEAGYIDNGRLCAKGLAALRPYEVDNAIIMAAGTSSRFVPIAYEKPKGLMRVRGEVLMERQIEQLRAAGIRDIIVIVGYKMECFFYLEDKYDVKILINHEFETRNNNGSLMVAKELLGNSYICSSDNYFTENPFERYVWKAYYATQYHEGPVDEFCVKTNNTGRITEVDFGGEDAWYMIGHAYFDREFSERFRDILVAEYDQPETTEKLWEQIYQEHIDELDMQIRYYDPPIIWEFDSLDQLRIFDPLFLENLDSNIFDNISAVLGCEKSEIKDVYPLTQSLTNLSCHFRTDDGEYVYRHPGAGTQYIIDRYAEKEALQTAKMLGLDNTFIFANPKLGWKISHFIPNSRQLDPHNEEELKKAMEIAATLHETTLRVDRTFDFYAEGKRYESLLLERGPIEVPGYYRMAEDAKKVAEFAASDNAPICLCHNDFFHLNFLIDENESYYLIDWEYAGMSDYANDFGTFCVCSQLSDEEAKKALEFYFGRKPTGAELRHNFALVALAGWCWYVWSLLKEAEGDVVGEWSYIYYRYAKHYLKRTLEMYRKAVGKPAKNAPRARRTKTKRLKATNKSIKA